LTDPPDTSSLDSPTDNSLGFSDTDAPGMLLGESARKKGKKWKRIGG
jgi:hypothetical protein